MATTLSGWARYDFRSGTTDVDGDRPKNPNPLVCRKETFTFDTGATDVYGTRIDFIPAGVDFTVLLVRNNTTSVGGDIVVQGSHDGVNWNTIKDDLIAYAAANGAPDYDFAKHDVDAAAVGEWPFYRLFLDGDGAHSASIGADKTMDLYVFYPARLEW